MKFDTNGHNRKSQHRRSVLVSLARGAGVGTGILLVAPKNWTRPVIDTVVLPGHAQATMPPIVGFRGRGILSSATSDTKTPSGGPPVEAFTTIVIAGCVNVANETVTCSAQANLQGSTVVDLGTGSAVTDATGAYFVEIMVPVSVIAPVRATETITGSCQVDTKSHNVTYQTPDIAAALAGTVSPPSCSL